MLTDSVTSRVSFTRKARLTGTNHNSGGKLILYCAFCIFGTRPDLEAGIETVSIKASLLARTIPISLAANFLIDGLRD